MTAATNFVQTEVPAPAYKTVAEQIIAIASALREQGHDQETIRVALQQFGNGVNSTPQTGRSNPF